MNIICYPPVCPCPSALWRIICDRDKIFWLEGFLLLDVGLPLFLCNCCRRRELRLDFVSVNILFWLRNALPMPNNFWKARKSRLKCKNKNKSSRKGCWISYLQHFGFKLEFIGKIDLPLCTGSDIWRRRKSVGLPKAKASVRCFFSGKLLSCEPLNQRWQPWKLLHKRCQHVNLLTCQLHLQFVRINWTKTCLPDSGENGQWYPHYRLATNELVYMARATLNPHLYVYCLATIKSWCE